MEKHPKLISFFSFILYVVLNYFFVSFATEHQIAGFSDEFAEVKKLLADGDSLRQIITTIAAIVTTVSVLVQYIIGKFLLVVFVPGTKTHLYYALMPKLLVLMVNIIFIGVFNIQNTWLYLSTALIGALLIMFFIQYKRNNWKATILFSLVFLLDSVFSLGKSIYSLF